MVTAVNDVTGDRIQTGLSNENFSKGFDQIDWSVKLEPTENKTNSEGEENGQK